MPKGKKTDRGREGEGEEPAASSAAGPAKKITKVSSTTILPGSLVTITGQSKHEGTKGIVMSIDAGLFEVKPTRFTMDLGDANVLVVSECNLEVDESAQARSDFTSVRCPTLGAAGDLQFSLNIDVTETQQIAGSIVHMGGSPMSLLRQSFATPGATITNISVWIYSRE